MNIIKRIFNRPNEQRATPMPTGSDGFWLGMGSSVAGVEVNAQTALFADAVWACVAVITDAIAGLPVHIKNVDTGEKVKAHSIARLLRNEPNPEMTAASFRTALMVNLLLHGAAYAFVERVGGQPVGLYPLQSANTYPARQNGKLQYVTIIDGKQHVLRPEQVIAITGLTFDGITGLSPVRYAAKQIGLSLVASTFAEKAFASGGNLGGLIETPPITAEAQSSFLESWRRNHAGIDNALKVAALPTGWKFTPTSTTPDKAQLLDTRIHQVRVIARIFKVPLHMIGDLERATFSNIEHQAIEFQQRTITPHIIRLEQELSRKLLRDDEQDTLAVSFNLDSLLRADTKARYEAHNLGLQGGWLTRNEVRRMEDLPPIDDGDTPLVPLNMGPASATGGGNPDTKTKRDAHDPTAVQAVIQDATARLRVKEVNALTRAIKKHGQDQAAIIEWVESFYADHQELATRTLTPAASLTHADPATMAATHCNEARRAISNAIESDTLNDLIATWQNNNPGKPAEANNTMKAA